MRLFRTIRRTSAHQLAGRELLRIDGEAVAVTLKLNPRARKLIVKVHPSTGEVTVVAPSRRALSGALDFARSETDWIRTKLSRVPKPVALRIGARIPFRGEMHVIAAGGKGRGSVWAEQDGAQPTIRVAGNAEYAPRRIADFLKREARRILDARSLHYAAQLGLKPSRVTVRDTASRWGSCSVTRSLSFSWRLILAPNFVLDYVVAHEVAHLKEMNHGPRFWKLVRDMVPNIEPPQRWLSQNGTMLHRYAPRLG
jgi:predicted metal-dependent hydrolase